MTWTPARPWLRCGRWRRTRGYLPGSKFETFLHADQVLGLDLAADIGRRRRAAAVARRGRAETGGAQREPGRRGDWATADRLRGELAAAGVIVSDTPTARPGRPGRGRPSCRAAERGCRAAEPT